MRQGSYMVRDELDEFIKMGAMWDEVLNMAKTTENPSWRRKFNTIAAYCKTITDERLALLEPVELEKVHRRAEKKQVMVYSKDEVKMLESRLSGKDKNMQVDAEAWIVLLKVIDQYVCRRCQQGEQVKKCEVRKLMHRCMAIPYQGNPGENECEFHYESKCDECGIKINEFNDIAALQKLADKMSKASKKFVAGDKRTILNIDASDFAILNEFFKRFCDQEAINMYSEDKK